MLKITEFTICLHCGCNKEIVNKQMASLAPIENEYKVSWNNRIDRYPHMYPTYSQLINHSIVTSKDEWVILINDRSNPKPEEIRKMISLLENGFACVLLYSVGFMGFSKELIRQIGWWDERFIQGWEDRDWVWRIKLANLALYESIESSYDYDWKSPLNHPAGMCIEDHLHAKYTFTDNALFKNLSEEKYQHWDLFLGECRPDISSSWKTWKDSILDVDYCKPNAGASGSSYVHNKEIVKAY